MLALADGGVEALTVEAVCLRAGKTRGSYYHHFESADDFERQLLAWWRRKFTTLLIEKAERATLPATRLDYLNVLVSRLDPRIERAVRHMAGRSACAGQICQEADARRVDFLARLYEQSARYTDKDARTLAQIEYAAWVGLLSVAPDIGPQDMLEMYDGFLRLTGRG